MTVALGAAFVFALLVIGWWIGRSSSRGTPTETTRAQEQPRRVRRREREHDGDSSGLRTRSKGSLEIAPLDPSDAHAFDDDADGEITVLRVEVEKGHAEPGAATEVFFADAGAEIDIPTGTDVTLVTSAIAQSHPGKKRRRNEDRYLKLDSHHVFAVADGMGGHAGGHIAAEIAVNTLRDAFVEQKFEAEVSGDPLPWRADELVKAVQQANIAIYARGRKEPWLRDMGTTLVAARFAPRKERLYVAHVGDSRCYRLRDGKLKQLTKDHTFGELGIIDDGPTSSALSRAVGVSPRLTIDVIVATPRLGDRYLVCSDGLPRMVDEKQIRTVLGSAKDIQEGADQLIAVANQHGGHDNVTVVVVDVHAPSQVAGLGDGVLEAAG